MLREHRARCKERARSLDTRVRRDGFVFSPSPDCAAMTNPDTVTQRYGRLAKRLGFDTHLHSLRRYSATELIAARASTFGRPPAAWDIWEAVQRLCGPTRRLFSKPASEPQPR